jgi:hypothetical protein
MKIYLEKVISRKIVTRYLKNSYLLFLKTDVNVPSVSNNQRNLFFVAILKATEEKSRIRSRIRNPVVRVGNRIWIRTKMSLIRNTTLL